MGRIITSLVIWLMRNTRFSLENRTRCITALLDKLNIIPHKDIIEIREDGTFINGRKMDLDKAKQLKSSAKAVLENQVRNIVREQVAFKAVNVGVHRGNTPEEIYFSKVALWIYQQENLLYEQLAKD